METNGSLWSLWVSRLPPTLGMTFIQIRTQGECKIIGGWCGDKYPRIIQEIWIRRGEWLPWNRKRLRIQCVPLGKRFHALYDNKWWNILWQIWQVKTWLQTYYKYDMTGIKISTNCSNFIVRGNHSNWGENWSIKRKTSVIGVTKPLRWVGGSPLREIWP